MSKEKEDWQGAATGLVLIGCIILAIWLISALAQPDPMDIALSELEVALDERTIALDELGAALDEWDAALNHLSAELDSQPDPMDVAVDELGRSFDKLQVALYAQWDIMGAVLERAWVATRPGTEQCPPDWISDSRVCWHVSELDVVVSGQLIEAWRCEARPMPCDSRFDDVCILGVGDGISWEFRTDALAQTIVIQGPVTVRFEEGASR